MADFDPEGLSLGEIPLIEPASTNWSRLLSILRGLIRPPALLTGIPAFPSSIQLPGLATLPALGTQVARQWIGFARERLPFLSTRAPAEQNGAAPQYEYRNQRQPRRSVFRAPLDWGAHPAGEPPPSDLQSQPIAQMGETANETWEEYHENALESFLPSRVQPLAQEMARALPAPHNEPAAAMEPVYLEADAWREPWGALQELPRALQPIGAEGQVNRVPSHPVMIGELASRGSSQRSGEEQTVEHTNLPEPGIQAPSPHTESPDLAAQILARHGIPNLLAVREPASRVQSATAVYRQLNLGSAARRELPAGGLLAATDISGFESGPLIDGAGARATEIEANAAALLQTIDRRTLAPSFPLSEQGPMLGEVLGRHEGVLPHLPQLEPQEIGTLTASPALQHAALETTNVSSPNLLAERVGGVSFLSAAAGRIHSPFEQGGVISRPPSAVLQGETRAEREAWPLGASIPTAAFGAAALSQLGDLAQIGELSRLQGWMEPGRLASQARAELPAINISERSGAVGASAEPAPPQILREMPTIHGGPAIETVLGEGLASVQAFASPAAETFGGAINAGERTMLAPARMEFAGIYGLESLGHPLTHVGEPPASGPSVETLSGSRAAGEHAAGQHESVAEHYSAQGVVAPPQMELRREAQAHPTQAYFSAGGPMMTQSSSAINAQGIEGVSMPGMVVAEPEAAPNEMPAASESGWSGAAPSAGVEESLNASPNLDAVARQVYAILKNELRAERDRHQLYSR
jgi:hypothetical protein